MREVTFATVYTWVVFVQLISKNVGSGSVLLHGIVHAQLYNLEVLLAKKGF